MNVFEFTVEENVYEFTGVSEVGPRGPVGVGVPEGGTTGQVLAKNSDTDYDTEWVTGPGGGGGAVDSVNGAVGVVVLDQDDIGDGATYKQYSQTEKTKLAGIATGATANSSDATLLARANHTGTQAISTVTGLQAAIDGKAATSHTHTLADITDEGALASKDTVATADIDNDAVTNAKQANMAVNTIKGRITTGTGDPEDLTATNVRTILNVANGATANDTDANLKNRANHTGTQTLSTISDVTASATELNYVGGVTSAIQTQLNAKAGTSHTHSLADITDEGALASLNSVGTSQIDNDSVTYAKMQNISATARLLGRVTAGSGDTEEVIIDADLSSVSASDDTIPSAKATKTALDLKAPIASPTFTGTVTLPTGLTGVVRTDSGVVSVDTDVTDIVAAASTTAQGKVELATTAETDTGTDATRAVTPDGLSGSVYGTKVVSIQVIDGATVLATGDGKAYFRIPTALNGMDLISCGASVLAKSTSGTPTIQLARGRQANATTAHAFTDMLSTLITIDANEFDSKDAAAAAVINTAADDVLTGDLIRVDVDVAGTGATGLFVTLAFRTP